MLKLPSIPSSWSEPNGSLKSFLYKMVHDVNFRGDIIGIVLFFVIWGGFCVRALRIPG